MGLRPFSLPLFTGVRGIWILRTSRVRSSRKFNRISAPVLLPKFLGSLLHLDKRMMSP